MKMKSSLKALKPYQPNTQPATLILDANESPNYLFDDTDTIAVATINRYPDSDAFALKKALAARFDMNPESLIIGSGSSELIELTIKTFVEPFGKILSVDPSFSMYQVYSAMHSAEYVSVPLKPPFTIDIVEIINAAKRDQPDLIVVCNPNNPTGSLIAKADLLTLLASTDAPILLDEAYMDFTDGAVSLFREAASIEKLIVTRTFSKAYGLAGARVGYLSANPAMIDVLKRVKTPYNMNSLSMRLAIKALEKSAATKSFIQGVQARRNQLKAALESLGIKTYPAHGNFVFIKSDKGLGARLLSRGVRIRDYSSYAQGFYRITVGTDEENRQLIKALKEML